MHNKCLVLSLYLLNSHELVLCHTSKITNYFGTHGFKHIDRFQTFKCIAFIIIIETQMITSLASGSLCKAAPKFFWHDPSSLQWCPCFLMWQDRSRLILYTSCAIPGNYHFSNKPHDLLVRNYSLKPYLVRGWLIATGSVFDARPFQWTEPGQVHVCRHIHMHKRAYVSHLLFPLFVTAVLCLHCFLALCSTSKVYI